jgi:hypothetical protein
MAVQKSTRAPYASTGSVTTVIEKHRQVGQTTMSLQRLQQIGVTEALAPRTMYALAFLGFYDENGNVTPEFDALRKAHEHDFKPRLAALLREAYAPILEVLDPATATPLDVENAFRGFEPTGQIPRMVQLFMGLMRYVEIMPDAASKRDGPAPRMARIPKVKPAGANGQSGHTGRSEQPGHSSVQPRREHEPEHQEPEPPRYLDGNAAERRDISLGDAGSVTVIVNVRWLDLSEDQFTKLRKLIKDIEALGDSGHDRREQVEVSP